MATSKQPIKVYLRKDLTTKTGNITRLEFDIKNPQMNKLILQHINIHLIPDLSHLVIGYARDTRNATVSRYTSGNVDMTTYNVASDNHYISLEEFEDVCDPEFDCYDGLFDWKLTIAISTRCFGYALASESDIESVRIEEYKCKKCPNDEYHITSTPAEPERVHIPDMKEHMILCNMLYIIKCKLNAGKL